MQEIKSFRVYQDKEKDFLYTKNLAPGKKLFDEELIKERGAEYRSWNIFRSKLAAAIKKGISWTGIKEKDIVLYLGASHGYTPSYVSDIVGKQGFVFCLDSAPRVVRDLIFICEQRSNMAPILADANHPEAYKDLITKQVDVVYQDIAQRNQTDIFLKNCDAYLKKGGYALLALKARSIDFSKKPKDIFTQVEKQLEKSMEVLDSKELDPYEKDHAMFVCRKKQ